MMGDSCLDRHASVGRVGRPLFRARTSSSGTSSGSGGIPPTRRSRVSLSGLLVGIVSIIALTAILWGRVGGRPSAHKHFEDTRILRALTNECAKGERTVIYVTSDTRQLAVQHELPSSCPLIDIALNGEERGVGMCADAALYVVYAGARIVPLPRGADMEAYERRCGAATARMSLESMYSEWVRPTRALHIMQVNSEHLMVEHAHLHRHIDLFLCKTRFCNALVRRYIAEHRLGAAVWYMGHSSLDPTVSPQPRPFMARTRLWREPLGTADEGGMAVVDALGLRGSPGSPDYSQFLHVKGTSGLKHTVQLLQCWSRHPEWPRLTVVGAVSSTELQALGDNATNVVVYPPPALATAPNVSAAPANPRLTSGEAVRQLQARMGVHVCMSEREGYGHYLNEARAAGALVLSTHHPPMNEMVEDGVSGLLVAPHHTGSWTDWQSLGNYTHINAFLTADEVCAGVARALALPLEKRAALGAAARQAYLAETAAFVRKARYLSVFLRQQPEVRPDDVM